MAGDESLHLAWHVNCHICQAKLLVAFDGQLQWGLSLKVCLGLSTKAFDYLTFTLFLSTYNTKKSCYLKHDYMFHLDFNEK